MNSALSCFFPTTVVFVDDNTLFLNELTETIATPNVIFKKFDDPIKALKYINETSATNRLDCTALTRNGEESTSNERSVLLNINRLHQEIYSFDRFSKISTVITDYSMPGMNGIELCTNIADSNIQKILLTAIADERVAINAFNDNRINRFIRKEANAFEKSVIESVNDSLYHYFSFYTDALSKYFPLNHRTHLKDPAFSNFFFTTCLDKSCVEYYMLDSFGGYLFLNADGKPTFLCVLTEDEMSRLVNLAIELGEVSQDVVDKLKSREYMLAFHNRYGQLPHLEKWENYLKPARRLDGRQTYYFSFADVESFDLDIDDIKSFSQFTKMQSD
jgi:CheY-like chemotaxis protein